MKQPPAYFERVRGEAARTWDQLERNPGLAGPWRQLFKQVQSPRHVLSELLQNADDAGATQASARIEDGAFVFEHDGGDFTEEHFASLCRFGYSNKRALHTIGFRGIGFKSTFSLGNRVELFTPTLSLCFENRRFTEPLWLAPSINTKGYTRIRVPIGDTNRQRAVEKNLDEWLKSPVSLLFFRNIRRLRIGDREVHWGSLGAGPVPSSEWMALHDRADETYLLIRSKAKPFPDDALEEIRQERLLGIEDEMQFPPCHVEIVLGAPGRLYVVLPTGVETDLPFACNAPFIQDPSRLKIKDPETSPTNRWLLKRAGCLAATAMANWLGRLESAPVERARAYRLFPDIDDDSGSLEGACGTIVQDAFTAEIEGKALLLTESGQLAAAQQAIILPDPLLNVWPAEQAASLLDDKGRPPFSHHVSETDRKKLVARKLVEEIDRPSLLNVLQEKHLPRPKTWRQLLNLWAYLAPDITGYFHRAPPEELRIVPVQGKDVLYAADEVVRLGEKKLLQSEGDWDFLAEHLIVLNQNWPRFLAEERRTAADQDGPDAQNEVKAAYAILEEIGLGDTSDVDKVVDQVAAAFFSQDRVTLAGSVQLAQIAAKLGASAGGAFRYVTRDRTVRAVEDVIYSDLDGGLEELLPEASRESQLLHSDYAKCFDSCSREDWLQWLAAGKSGLRTFVPLVEGQGFSGRRHKLDDELKRRSCHPAVESRYSDPWFYIMDWDFEPAVWQHWQKISATDTAVWRRVAERLLSEKPEYWSQKTSARIVEQASNGHSRTIARRDVTPRWVLRLRDLPCLLDSRGFVRQPGELLRRTPATEPLMDVEPFIYGLLDNETTRPLLDLLGVRSAPTGPDRILERLRALAKAPKPPAHEVEKWYRRLDQVMSTCSTEDFQKIRQAFRAEKLILTEDGTWSESTAAFLSSSEDDVPDAPVIRAAVADLTLWRKIDIADRPTVDLAIAWLKTLPSGKALSPEESRRARTLLARYPLRVWEECAHWLNLAGEWTPAEALAYALTMQSLVPWSHLHPWVKQKTADFQRVPSEITTGPPFSTLPLLAAQIEERFHRTPLFTGRPEKKEWLHALGAGLRRIELDVEEETTRVRGLAERLTATGWVETPSLEIVPYIDGTPAGTPRQADVVWFDRVLHARPLPRARLARLVPDELHKSFVRSEIRAALDYSFERSAREITEYLEENFKLAPANTLVALDGSDAHSNPVGQPGEVESVDIVSESNVALLAIAYEIQPDDDTAPQVGSTAEVEEGEVLVDVLPEPEPRPRPTQKPAKPGIIERFARGLGFKKDGEERFFHDSGAWIGRANGARFPWEHRSPTGNLVRYYLPFEHCLEREPLPLDADIWTLLDQHPETYALILSNLEGNPVEVTGARLRTMREGQELELFPATYRLVYDHERNARDRD